MEGRLELPAGEAALVHPPKSSSAVIVVPDAPVVEDLVLDEVSGEPHPPPISFGVMWARGLPRLGAEGLGGGAGADGSGVDQALVSAEAQGSNKAADVEVAAGTGAGVGLEIELGTVGLERLKAEFRDG